MIYSVNYEELTENLNPLAVVKYLKDTGWTLFPTKKDYLRVYQLDFESDFYQVIVPMDKHLSDYRPAMNKVVTTISEAENRSFEQVFLFLLNPNTDILKIRLDRPDIESGNILLDDAINTYENAKKLLAATTLDVLNPKIIHLGRNDNAVAKFLSNCRFGQTEIGSYIVSIICPFAKYDETSGFQQLSIFADESQSSKSLTRQVTTRVMRNIATIKKRIDAGENPIKVNSDPNDIISINFFEALNGLNLNFENTHLEFTAEWSPIVKNLTPVENQILLTSDYYQPIESAINQLKDTENKATKIVGRIKRLESAHAIEKRKTGKASIVYLNDDNKARTVTAELEKIDYDQAIEAHLQGKYVEIIGDLSSNSKTIQCQSFNVLEY